MSFAVRLVNADFYSENPINGFDVTYSEFRAAQIAKVPVIRIFGSTPAGQKTCLHVHGVFPYVYIPYDGTQPKERYLFLLACSLDKAINISMGTAEASTRYVHDIELVNRIPFYGYHRKEHQFLKIYFYNPFIVKKAVELLQNGAVMSRHFQLYFAHIPYLLQMFIDYNLYGMNMVQLSNVKFRRKIRKDDCDGTCRAATPPNRFSAFSLSPETGSLNAIWDPYNIPKHMRCDDTVISKSTCCLEADCLATDILNRAESAGVKMNPGIAFIWEDERQRRRLNGLDSQMSLPSSQDRNYVVATDSEEYFLQRLKEQLAALKSEFCDTSRWTSQSQDTSGIESDEIGTQNSGRNEQSFQDNLDETVVDAEVALSLSLPSSIAASQNSTRLSLDSNDMELAGILQDLASSQSSGCSLWLTQQSPKVKDGETDEECESDDETLMWTQEDLIAETEHERGCEEETILVTNDEKTVLQGSWDWQNEDYVIPQVDGPGDVLPQPKRKLKLSLSTKSRKASQENLKLLSCAKIEADSEKVVRKRDDSNCADQKSLLSVCKFGSLQVALAPGIRARDLEAIGREVLCIDKLQDKEVRNERRRAKDLSTDGIAATRSKRPNVNYGPNRFTHLYDKEDWPIASQGFCQDDVSTCKLFGCLYHSPSKAKVLLKRVDSYPTATVKPFSENLPRRLSAPDAKNASDEEINAIASASLKCRSTREDETIVAPTTARESIGGTQGFVATKLTQGKLEIPNYWAAKKELVEDFNTTLCNTSFTIQKRDREIEMACRPWTVISAESDETASESLPQVCNRLENSNERIVVGETQSSAVAALEPRTPVRSRATQGIDSFYEYSPSKRWLSQSVTDAAAGKTKTFSFCTLPPSAGHVEKTMSDYGIPHARHASAFYGRARDVPAKAPEVGGRVLKLKSNATEELPEFEGRFQKAGVGNWKMILSLTESEPVASKAPPRYSVFEPVRPPPSRKAVEKWLTVTCKVPVISKQESDMSRNVQRLELPPIEISPIRVSSQNRNNESERLSMRRTPGMEIRFGNLCSTPAGPKLSPSGDGVLRRSFSDGEETGNSQKRSKKVPLGLKATKQRRLSFDDNLRKKTLVTRANAKGRKDGSRGNSQIDAVALDNTYGFKVSPKDIAGARAAVECHGLTVMSMELHANTRGSLCPDPHFDAVRAVFYHIKHDVPDSVIGSSKSDAGVILSEKNKFRFRRNILERTGCAGVNVTIVDNEVELIAEFTRLVIECDPDIILGYEIQMTSWGYLLERAEVLGITLAPKISRIPDELKGSHLVTDDDEMANQTSEIYIRGRIVLNVWRIMRSETTLTSYTFESVFFHVLHRRTAKYPYQMLTQWFDSDTDLHRWKTVRYYILRAEGNILLLDKLDVVTRTSELAKLFGILFYDVLSRGSQFRVESMMHRLTTASNYITVSPSIQQRAQMRAPECIQLILEPESRFYTHPVVVLDFQSLYPSMVIAYNYCYSTCLGRVEHHGKSEPFDFGCTMLKVPPNLLKSLEGKIHYSPTGIAFVDSDVRRGILPQMLDEILNTRIMVKNALKKVQGDRGLEKLLDARQLGLKLIANVTYGYTSAHFSGRMPCSEVGDSILGKARETLERAIKLVETTRKWDAKVVYGDTDSMFVLLTGRSREDAFRVGREIADAVTACNPSPVRLKFEKVYLPCVLQTKKRYVGMKYESESQTVPGFDAKGIETVRRDGCPAAVKVLEKSLHILFETRDVSKVKEYVQKQFTKLLSGRASAQDYIFAREYRGASSYRTGAHVAALEIAKRRLREDPRSEPRTRERVPYVIVYGSPGLPLIRLVREPQDLLKDPSLRLNAHYYVNTVICAPLQRVFSLVGADVNTWYAELPRVLRAPYMAAVSLAPGASISRYFTVDNCPVCNEPSGSGGNVCGDCRSKPQIVGIVVAERARKAERKYAHHQMICKSCTGVVSAAELDCSSLDCPVLFRFHQAKWDCAEVTRLRSLQW